MAKSKIAKDQEKVKRAKEKRDHHFEWHERDYKEIKLEIMLAVTRAMRVLKEFNDLDHKMKRTETARRENAFHMGVPLHESDATFNFDELKTEIPLIMEAYKKLLAQFGVN